MLESVIDTRFSTSKYWVVDSTQEYGLYAAPGGTAGVPCLQFSRQPPSVWNTPSQCGETEAAETKTESGETETESEETESADRRVHQVLPPV